MDKLSDSAMLVLQRKGLEACSLEELEHRARYSGKPDAFAPVLRLPTEMRKTVLLKMLRTLEKESEIHRESTKEDESEQSATEKITLTPENETRAQRIATERTHVFHQKIQREADATGKSFEVVEHQYFQRQLEIAREEFMM